MFNFRFTTGPSALMALADLFLERNILFLCVLFFRSYSSLYLYYSLLGMDWDVLDRYVVLCYYYGNCLVWACCFDNLRSIVVARYKGDDYIFVQEEDRNREGLVIAVGFVG